jgi:serine/threonine protein kinase
VAGGERAKILDFGIAKITDQSGMKTETAVVMGTPMFMSPEQCRGAGKVDQRSDVYSLGCVLFTLLTGRTPFVGEGPGDVIAMHLRESPPAPSMISRGIPASIDALVLRCLAKDPAHRYSSGDEIASALRDIKSSNVGAAASHSASRPTEHLHSRAARTTTLSAYAQERGSGAKILPNGRIWAVASSIAAVGIAISWFVTSSNSPATKPPPAKAGDQIHPPAVRQAAAETASEVKPPAVAAGISPSGESSQIASPKSMTSAEAAAPRPSPSHASGAVATNAQPPSAKLSADSPSVKISADSPSVIHRPAGNTTLETTPKPIKPATTIAITCTEQYSKLKAFIDRSYSLSSKQVVQQAKALRVSCLDELQLSRLATLAIPAACTLNDEPSVIRFYTLARSPRTRSLCRKYLAPDEVLHIE